VKWSLIIVLLTGFLVACTGNQSTEEKATLQELVSTEDAEMVEQDEQDSDETIKESQPMIKPSSGKETEIKWDEFFDNEKQDRPSQKFWDLKGQEVVIHGFMAEVLSLEKGWFLLIPSPGAECPFDNGDESYWNKIMIVFVEDSKGLRFTEGPLEVRGVLDVGVKVDESNYKTMFRLYDATFQSLN